MLIGLCACDASILDELGVSQTLNNFIKTINGEKITAELDKNSIKIGVFEPQTGKYAADAEDEIRGIRLANKLFPKVLDQTVELVFEDNHSEPEYAVDAAQALVDSGCNIVIGSYSNILTMAATDIFEENKVVCVCPSCTNPLITTTTDYFFRVDVVDAFQGNGAAKYIIEHLPILLKEEELKAAGEYTGNISQNYNDYEPVTCAVLKKSDDERATALIERFQAKIQEVYGSDNYVQVYEYNGSGAVDMSPYFDRFKEAGVKAVFFPSAADEGERVIYEAYKKGYYFEWVGASDWANILQASEDAERKNSNHLEGVAYVAAFDKAAAATEMTETFLTAVKSYYKTTTPSEAMALGFDAYLLALKAIEDAGGAGNSENLQYAMSRIRELVCSTGSITFRAGNGDPVKDVVIERVVNGKIKAEYTAVPVWSKTLEKKYKEKA